MRGARETYLRAIHDNLGYLAIWLPTVRLRVGDVGTIEDGEFQKTTDLKALGLSFKTEKTNSAAALGYTSSDSVDMKLLGAGDAGSNALPGNAGARLTLEFKRANAVVFQAGNCSGQRVANLADLERAVLSARRSGGWDPRTLIITETLEAEGCTVVISAGSDARVELTAEGKLQTGSLDLTGLSAKLSLQKADNVAFHLIGERGLTPLFRAHGLKKPLFRPERLTARGGEPEENAGASAETFESLDVEDLLSQSDS